MQTLSCEYFLSCLDEFSQFACYGKGKFMQPLPAKKKSFGLHVIEWFRVRQTVAARGYLKCGARTNKIYTPRVYV
jgi:hypothetical protein